MRRDHNPAIFEDYLGLYTRCDSFGPPPGFSMSCRNIVFDTPDQGTRYSPKFGKARTRESFVNSFTLNFAPVRWYFYFKSTGTRIIYLDSTGNFRDHSAGGAIIKTIASATDFQGITINDRFYFTPHDGTKGLTGEAVYVYDSTLAATARKAAGIPAVIGTFAAAVSATNGTVEPGLHVISVSFETDTGFITKPAAHVTVTAPNPRKKIDLTNIPVGGAGTGTIARWIWISKRVINYDGNPVPIETFFIAKINDNTTTSLTIDAYDSQLVTSSDPYDNLLSEIPAGTFINAADGRMAVCGSFTNAETIYISNVSEPEAVDAVDGLLNVGKGDGGRVLTTRILRGLLYCWKSFRTFSVEPSDDTPKNWRVRLVDTAMGSTVYGVSEVLSSYNCDVDTLLVGNTSGVWAFNGAYQQNVIYAILPTYLGHMNLTNLRYLKTSIDPLSKRAIIGLPTNGPTLELYYLDYSEGWNRVKISSWDTNTAVNGFLLDLHHVISSVNGRAKLFISGPGSLNLLEQVSGVLNTAATDQGGFFTSEISFRIPNPELMDQHLGMVVASVGGFVHLQNNGLEFFATGENPNAEVHDFTPSAPGGSEQATFRERFNITDIPLEVGIRGLACGFQLAKLIAYVTEERAER